MSPTLYALLWAIYLIAGLLLMWMVWLHTRWQKLKWLGTIIQMIVLVLVFTPAKLYHQPDFLVPAIISLGFDQVLGHEEAAFSAAVNLMVAAIVLSLIFVIYYVVLQILHSRKKN